MPDTALLERHRPILRLDARERFLPSPVERVARGQPLRGEAIRGLRERGRPPGVTYGRLVRRGRSEYLQYWLFYADNPQDRGIVRTGRHEGDWELVQLRLDERRRPARATLSQHSWAESCAWSSLRRKGEAPVLFVANGSHAIWSRPGSHGRPFPDPDDDAGGRGASLRPRVVPISDRSPAWVRWPGRFGGSEAGPVPGEKPSPQGPRFNENGAWASPAGYERRARACGSGAPSRLWLTLPLIALAALFAALAGLRVRRRFLQSPA